MAVLDGQVKAAAAVVCGVFALLILLGGHRRVENRWLALFLFLVAGNAAFEAWRAMTADVVVAGVAFRVATALAIADPFVLFYFASLYPERNAWNAPRPVAALLGCSVALMLVVPWIRPPTAGHLPSALAWLAWAAFTAAVYVGVFVRFALLRLADPTNRAIGPMLAALALATVPALPRVLDAAGYVTAALGGFSPQQAGLASILWLLVPVLFFLATARTRDRVVVAAAAAGSILALALNTRQVLVGLVASGLASPAAWEYWPPAVSRIVDNGGGALRWILFSILASVAIVRHDALGMSVRARRRAARVFVGSAFFVLLGSAIGVARRILDGAEAFFTSGDLVVLGFVVALSQGMRSLVDHAAAAAYGVPRPGDSPAALEAYRKAVAQAIREGRAPLPDATLARLAEEMGIPPHVARLVEAAEAAAEEGPVAVGRTIAGRYRVVREVGRGGAGRALLARDTLLDRDVVLKEVLLHADEDEEALLQEARIAGGLQHPNLVTVHDVLRRPGRCLVVMEHLAGGSLADRLPERGSLDPAEAARILDGVLAGLEAVHAAGVVHRDVKPANVLFHENGAPKLADFGLARVRRLEGTVVASGPGYFAGTPAFMAPEQRAGKPATARSDVHAAGLLARRLADRWPPAVDAVIARALAEDADERYRDAGEMRRALEAALSDGT